MNKKSAPIEIDPAFGPVVAAFDGDDKVTSGKMMASFGLKVNGKVFAMSIGGKMVVKLPKARVDALIASGAGEPFDPRRNGRVMKEWVAVPSRKPTWVALAREAHQFVGG